MFRIVDDIHPPIPETVSSLLDDFLRQCFQKDPIMRPDAKTLSDHEWLKNSRPYKVLFSPAPVRGRCADEIVSGPASTG